MQDMSRSERAPVLGAHPLSHLKVNANQWTKITESVPEQAKPFLPYLILGLAVATVWQILFLNWPIVVCNDHGYVNRFPFVSGTAAINAHVIASTAFILYLWLYWVLRDTHPKAAYRTAVVLIGAVLITGLICQFPSEEHPVSDHWLGLNPHTTWPFAILWVVTSIYILYRDQYTAFWLLMLSLPLTVLSIIFNLQSLPQDDKDFRRQNDLETISKPFTLAC